MLQIYMSTLDDEREKEQFIALYNRMGLRCLRIANSITKDQGLAEDALHNAFLKVLVIRKAFFDLPCHKQDSKIVIIVKRKAIDILRARKPTVDIFGDFGAERVPDKFDVGGSYNDAESYETLRAHIRALPDIYRVAFEMRYVEDMSNAQIADELGVSENVVAQRLVRAKKRLQIMLKESGESYGL